MIRLVTDYVLADKYNMTFLSVKEAELIDSGYTIE
ncbi:MAG: hypothetical protein K0S41_933 [Anaerocolumna sp.]|jgi:hypothetical protein|nr:hypothetical protein [Anaerocolumna sp.]